MAKKPATTAEAPPTVTEAAAKDPETAAGMRFVSLMALVTAEAMRPILADLRTHSGVPPMTANPTPADWDLFLVHKENGIEQELGTIFGPRDHSPLTRWWHWMNNLANKDEACAEALAEARDRMVSTRLQRRLQHLRGKFNALQEIPEDWGLDEATTDLVERLAGEWGDTDEGHRKRIVLEDALGKRAVAGAIADVRAFWELQDAIEQTERELEAEVPHERRVLLDRKAMLDAARAEREACAATA